MCVRRVSGTIRKRSPGRKRNAARVDFGELTSKSICLIAADYPMTQRNRFAKAKIEIKPATKPKLRGKSAANMN